MPSMGFEPTISVLERAKTVHALDRAATVIGIMFDYRRLFNDTVSSVNVILLGTV
jgi:hypothetical protein